VLWPIGVLAGLVGLHMFAVMLLIPDFGGEDTPPPFPAEYARLSDFVAFGEYRSEIVFRADGTATVTEFPFSERGPNCNPDGDRLISGSATWNRHRNGRYYITIEGQEMNWGPRAWFGLDWGTLIFNICDDDRASLNGLEFVGGNGA
jgi:hypothetical protein